MLKVNELGENLNILINCEYLYCHDWMSFVSWYSIKKYLPDANVFVNCIRKSNSGQFFRWTTKLNVPFYLNKEFNLQNCLKINPYVFAIRELNEENVALINNFDLNQVCSAVKSDHFTPFVSCDNGLGNFVLSEWINKLECPLSNMDRYISLDVNFNEIRVLSMMSQLASLYSSVSRS